MRIVHLIEPDEKYIASYAEAVEEYRAHQVDDYAFTDPEQVDVMQKFRDYRSGRNLKLDRVAATYYWLVNDEGFIGEIIIRHSLNETLLRCGGHIGYGIRRTCWNQGFGTKMLALGLEKAKEMGLQRVLITCDEHNAASARVIEKNRGVLQDRLENDGCLVRRYWIDL